MERAAHWSWKALVVLAFVGYPFLAHFAINDSPGGTVYLLLVLSLPLVLACWGISGSSNKPYWLAVLFALGIALYLLEHRERLGVVAVSGLTHAGTYLFLLWYFARTLRDGKEPLITRLARRVHGALPLEIVAFTRRVTLAWCVFFAAQVVVSMLLFAFASLETWSMFVNLINVPLLALMFASEYLYRAVRYPNHPRASIARVLRAFAEEASVSLGAKAR